MSNISIKLKHKADGRCGVCNKLVPQDFCNKFYCSYHCCDIAYNYFHPIKPEQYEEEYYQE